MPLTISNTHPTSNGRELSKLLTAAVVNANFRKLLLTNPAQALSGGYNGEVFHLTKEEHEHIVSIKAKTLAEFANSLIETPIKTIRRPVYARSEAHVLVPTGMD